MRNVSLRSRLILLAAVFFATNALAQTPPVLTINEVDYDQAGTDAAEYIELFNAGPGSINLTGFTLELVNGTGGGATIYNTISLPGITLAANDFYVICGNAANVANCDLDVTPDTNLIQNGAPDAIGLRDGSGGARGGGILIDAVSYEGDSGAPYTEGSGTGLVDNPGTDNFGISRCPDGFDTNQNNTDLIFVAITPGAANACPGANSPPVATDDEFTTDEDTVLMDNVITNVNPNGADSDPDMDMLMVTLVNGDAGNVDNQFALASGALLTVNADGALNYDPNGQFEALAPGGMAMDTFTYTISDGMETDMATVTITITGVDDAPVAVADMATVDEDSGATTIDVLSNDMDVDGGPRMIASVTQPAGGMAVVAGDNLSLTYQPNADFCNDGAPTDDFMYTLNGGSSATVAVTVNCINDAPSFTLAGNQMVLEDAGAQNIASFLTGLDDGDPEATQTVTIGTSNDNNALFSAQPTIDGAGNLSFTPAADANGSASHGNGHG